MLKITTDAVVAAARAAGVLYGHVTRTVGRRAALVFLLAMATQQQLQLAPATAGAKPQRTEVTVRRQAPSRGRATTTASHEAARLGFTHVAYYKAYKVSGVKVPDYMPAERVSYILREAKTLQVPQGLTFRLIDSESTFKEHAESHCGAKGYMQIMPDTRRRLMSRHSDKVRGLHPWQQNVRLGMLYLKELHAAEVKLGKRGNRAWHDALTYYNAGGRQKARQRPKVQAYARRIVGA